MTGNEAKCFGCEGSCDNPDCIPRSFLSPQCLCPDGYVREIDGDPTSDCIKKDECKQDCKSLIPMTLCQNGAIPQCEGCDVSCDRPDCLPRSYGSPRCLCPDGYVRQTASDPNSQCIPKYDCKSDCESKIPLVRCGFGAIPKCEGCDGSCKQPKCLPRSYFSPRCLCPDGYVRQNEGDSNSQCVPIEDCTRKCEDHLPIRCPDGEVASCHGCDGNCDWSQCDPVSYILPRCLCPPDTVRSDPNDPKSPCIPYKECTLKQCEKELPTFSCPEGELRSCESCDGTCQEPSCTEQVFRHPQCVCQGGYVRDQNWQCIYSGDCFKSCYDKLNTSAPCTIAGQELSCSACDITCEQYAMGAACLPAILDEPQCFCKPGYYKMNSNPHSTCIPEEFCFKKRCGCKRKLQTLAIICLRVKLN